MYPPEIYFEGNGADTTDFRVNGYAKAGDYIAFSQAGVFYLGLGLVGTRFSSQYEAQRCIAQAARAGVHVRVSSCFTCSFLMNDREMHLITPYFFPPRRLPQ